MDEREALRQLSTDELIEIILDLQAVPSGNDGQIRI